MKRSGPLQRRRPLARGRSRLKARRVPKAFRQRRNPAYTAWIREQPCLLALHDPDNSGHPVGALLVMFGAWFVVEAAHVRSRGAGGDDRGNLVPLCRLHHEEQHRIGIRSFQARWGINLPAEAERLYVAYCADRGNT